MSDSVRLYRRQPIRLPHPWDSPGKNTGVGCHFLLQCMKVKSESEVAQSCLTLSDPVDCSPPSSSIHGIFQARVLTMITNCSNGIQIYFIVTWFVLNLQLISLITIPAKIQQDIMSEAIYFFRKYILKNL